MPTYEYKCEKCGYRFEQFQKMTDHPLEKCPKCTGKVKRLISTGAGLIFKGKGFYHTDYKTSAASEKNKPSKTDRTPPCGKSESCPGCAI